MRFGGVMDKELAKLNWERIYTAMSFEEPDQVPFFLNVNGPFFASFAGVDIYEYYHSPEIMLETQLALYRRFPGLTPITPDVSVAGEPSALGAEITFTKDGTPWAVPFVKTEEDIERLKVPDVEDAGYMTRALNYYRYMREKTDPDIAVTMGSGHSPFGVACLIRDTAEMMTDLVSNPAFAKKLLQKTKDLVLMWFKTQEKILPPECFKRILIWDDLAAFVSLTQFREFILPLYEEIYDAFPQCERWYHNDADTTYILEGLADAKIQMFHYGYETDPAFIKEKIGDRVCLMGNIPPLEILRNGTPQDVEGYVKDVIAKSGRGGGLVVAAGGFLDEGTPMNNLEAMIRACEKYGQRDNIRRLASRYANESAAKDLDAETPQVEQPTPTKSPRIQELRIIQAAIINGKFREIENLTNRALAHGLTPKMLLDEAMIPGMEIVGQRFSDGKIFIPEMMVAARAMHAALGLLTPLFAGSKVKKGQKIAIGTVKEDLHDIGKNIVVSMMQGGGFDVMDLGVDCAPDKFVQSVEDGAKVIGMSAILTTTLPNMQKTIELLKQKGLRDKICVLVGGAAVTPAFASEIGADAYCKDAATGVVKAKDYVSSLK
jgi:methylmalonyl-CoA mutase cobalamin-binding domain/chain